MSGEPTKAEIYKKTATLYAAIKRTAGDHGFNVQVHDLVLAEVAVSLLKDMYRLEKHQNRTVRKTSWIGYIIFWIVKLKPIRSACYQGKDIADANEQIAVRLAAILFKEMKPGQFNPAYTPRQVEAFLKRIFLDYIHQDYSHLIYSLRHRNLTGDAISLWLEGLESGALTLSRMPGLAAPGK